jgi:cellulose synthase/poly-beta-1,6-N-acetylglucosamine synthase-like glycosyltransferase
LHPGDTSLSELDKLPLISIIIPAYNAYRYIGEALDSVLCQTFTNWECLVIDDASTDDTAKIVFEYQARDSRFRSVLTEGLRVPASVRNVGLKEAKGDYIAFLDSDDCFYPDALEKMLSFFDAQQGTLAVHGFVTHIDENSRPVAMEIPQFDLVKDEQGRDQLSPLFKLGWFELINGHFYSMLPCMMLSRQALEMVGYLNETLYNFEDTEYYIRLYLTCGWGRVQCVPVYVYRYRLHPASLTQRDENADRLLQNCLRAKEWVFSLPDLPSEIASLRSRCMMQCYHYVARERLDLSSPLWFAGLFADAWKRTDISLTDWLRVTCPMMARVLLPKPILNPLMDFAWALMNKKR